MRVDRIHCFAPCAAWYSMHKAQHYTDGACLQRHEARTFPEVPGDCPLLPDR
jgi:hypothetical protein